MAAPVTPTFRSSYPNVFKTKKNPLSGNSEFSIMCLFDDYKKMSKEDKAAYDKMVKLVYDAAVEKFGEKKHWPKTLRKPFRDQADRSKKDEDGNEYLPEPYVAGHMWINLKAREDRKPSIVDQDGNKIIEPSEFYAGCYARASYSVYAYDKGGNCGVNISLNNIQKVADGEPLGGSRTTAEEDFTPIERTGGGDGSASDMMDMMG